MTNLTSHVPIVLILMLLATGAIFGGVFEEVSTCVETFDSDNATCVSILAVCYSDCLTSVDPLGCKTNCDNHFRTCIADAAIGGALGIPQGFWPCLQTATYEEPMLEDDAIYLYNVCTQDCSLRRDDCLSMSGGEWTDECFEMSVSCTMSCYDLVPLNF